jgi:hypothetical protein
MHNFWWAGRSISLLTTHQNLAQTDTIWLSKQSIYQNCSVQKWQQTELTRHLSNSMFYSTNTQTNLRYWRVLSEEWDHQVWGQSNFVWVTNRRLEENRCSATKSGQISCSSPFFCFTHWGVCFALSHLSHSCRNLSLAEDGGYSLPDVFLREQFPPLI